MPKPDIVVLGHSKPWCSVIERSFPNAHLSWILNTDSLVNQSLAFRGAAAIVEIPLGSVEKYCRELGSLANNSDQLKLFAVGDGGLEDWTSLLAAAGFAACYSSFLQVPGLVRAVARHHRRVTSVAQSVEASVWSGLPWPTAVSGRQD